MTDLFFTPDGKALISVADDPVVRLWDTSTGKEVRSFGGHEGNVTAAAGIRELAVV